MTLTELLDQTGRVLLAADPKAKMAYVVVPSKAGGKTAARQAEALIIKVRLGSPSAEVRGSCGAWVPRPGALRVATCRFTCGTPPPPSPCLCCPGPLVEWMMHPRVPLISMLWRYLECWALLWVLPPLIPTAPQRQLLSASHLCILLCLWHASQFYLHCTRAQELTRLGCPVKSQVDGRHKSFGQPDA